MLTRNPDHGEPDQKMGLTTNPFTGLNICYVSTVPPRRCGIAIFTRDLSDAVSVVVEGQPPTFVALDDSQDGVDHSPGVGFCIRQEVIRDYSRAAEYINGSSAHVVNLHHEFSMFGGVRGNYVSVLLKCLDKPVVTTCHTILDDPTREERNVFQTVAALSDRLVCMSQTGSTILEETYRVPKDKIRIIELGVPDLPFVAPRAFKKQLNLHDRMVLLTFGLHGSNKGIASVVQALPHILERCPRTAYLILGQTHPGIKKVYGDRLRSNLERLVRELGLEGKVIFHNRFFDERELLKYVLASDICITPYLWEKQTSSAVLALAIGAGKAVVSSPFRYARDLLKDGAGILADPENPRLFAEALIRLIEDGDYRDSLRQKAYLLGRTMIWDVVAPKYVRAFKEVQKENSTRRPPDSRGKTRKLINRCSAELLASCSVGKKRFARLIDLVYEHQWREIAKRVVKNLGLFTACRKNDR